MPNLKSLPKLEDIAREKIISWLLHCSNNYLGPLNRKIQRAYIESLLGGNLGQQLLNTVLKTSKNKLDLYSKCLILELLCNQSTLYIDLIQGGSLIIEEVFRLYRTLLHCLPVGLARFGLICDIKPGVDQRYITDVNSFFYRILGQMKNLRSISLVGVGDTEILKQIGLNCEQLEYLDVTNSWKVNDRSVACLLYESPNICHNKSIEQLIGIDDDLNMCCFNLRFIGLSGTDISNKSIAMCFINCPRVVSFGGYIHQGSVTNILELVQSKLVKRKYNIRELWEDKISESQVELLSYACPLLTSLSTSSESLYTIHNLSSLTSLTLDCDFQDWNEELYTYLLSNGSKLKSLKLNDNVNCKLDIGWLMELTPSLVTLSAHVYYSNVGYPVTWSSLQNADIVVDSSKCVHELLIHTPEIENLNLKFVGEPYCEDETSINDDLMIDIATYGGLHKAKNIKIGVCGLGIVAVETLLAYCSDLQSISTLSLWKNFTAEHLNELEKRVKEANWDLKLIFY